jgi:hypothetical protein
MDFYKYFGKIIEENFFAFIDKMKENNFPLLQIPSKNDRLNTIVSQVGQNQVSTDQSLFESVLECIEDFFSIVITNQDLI